MQIESPEMAPAMSAPMGDDLAEGLMLLRASTLKIVRLQLAMERHDRRAALESIDDLVTLDRRLQDHLATLPCAAERGVVQRELDAERAMLNLEKLTLGAEVQRRSPTRIVEQQHVPDDAWLGPRDLMTGEDQLPHRRRWWLIVVPLIASVLAASTYFVSFSEAYVWLAAAGLK